MVGPDPSTPSRDRASSRRVASAGSTRVHFTGGLRDSGGCSAGPGPVLVGGIACVLSPPGVGSDWVVGSGDGLVRPCRAVDIDGNLRGASDRLACALRRGDLCCAGVVGHGAPRATISCVVWRDLIC